MVRGEIWWASLSEPAGSGPGYRRPVLVIQSNPFNKSKIYTVVCAVITSNLRFGNAPGNVTLSKKESKLPKDSVINVSQIVTLDKSFLTERVSSISISKMDRVDSGIRLVLNL